MLQTKIKEKPRPKEIIYYEQAIKRRDDALKELHEAALKKALYEEGLDTKKISRQDLDAIRRIRDAQGPVRQKYQELLAKTQQEAQQKMAALQEEAQVQINKINADFQEEIGAAQLEIQDIIERLRKEQGVTKPESPKEEVNKEETEQETGKEDTEDKKEEEETKK